MGKVLILDTNVADYYAATGYEVENFTGDEGLKAYEPVSKPMTPRRRMK